MYCKKCGNEVSENQKFCKTCGTPVGIRLPEKQVRLEGVTRQQQTAKKEPFNPKRLIVILASLALVIAIVVGILWIATSGNQRDNVTDPTTITPSLDKLENDIEREDFSENVPQEISPAKMLMPDCIGLHYSEAVHSFESIPCQLSFFYVYSDTVAENYIVEQNLVEGNELTAETEVILTVSKGPDVAPEGYNQKVTIIAAPDSSYGILTLYDWEEGQWVSKFSCDATLGSKGISPDYGEGKKCTPEGIFNLGVALTANSLPNSNWPVYLVSSDTCVVDDVNSSAYNTIQSIQSLPNNVSYDPIGRTITQGTSNICIYIEHNGNGYDSENVVAGKGSVITICGRHTSIEPTSGCVDISASNMKQLVSMLSYEKNPHIEIYTE